MHPCPVSLEPGPTCPTRDPAWSVVQLFSRSNLASHFISPPTSSLAGSLRALSQHEGAPVPLPWQAFCPHDRSIVLCLLRAVQLNIANPSTGKQKLIEIEDEKKAAASRRTKDHFDPTEQATFYQTFDEMLRGYGMQFSSQAVVGGDVQCRDPAIIRSLCSKNTHVLLLECSYY